MAFFKLIFQVVNSTELCDVKYFLKFIMSISSFPRRDYFRQIAFERRNILIYWNCKLVTTLRLGLSHLREHKFKHSFQDIVNPLCSCGLDIETASHYFLLSPLFHAERYTLLNNINENDSTIFSKSELVLTLILLYSDESFKDEVNLLVLNATIDSVLSTNRFDKPVYLL